MNEIKRLILDHFNLNPNKGCNRQNTFTWGQAVDAILDTSPRNSVNKILGVSNATITSNFSKAFGKKPASSQPWPNYIFNCIGYKKCYGCLEIKSLDEFHKSKNRDMGKQSSCKVCAKENLRLRQKNNPEINRAYSSKYNAKKLQRTPPWINDLAILEFYEGCPKGYHVDHIIPLQGERVSGLHVLENLQYLPASENLSKSNRFEIT